MKGTRNAEGDRSGEQPQKSHQGRAKLRHGRPDSEPDADDGGPGDLAEEVGDYREILVTREAKGNPADPGPIFLRGPIQRAGSGGG